MKFKNQDVFVDAYMYIFFITVDNFNFYFNRGKKMKSFRFKTKIKFWNEWKNYLAPSCTRRAPEEEEGALVWKHDHLKALLPF